MPKISLLKNSEAQRMAEFWARTFADIARGEPLARIPGHVELNAMDAEFRQQWGITAPLARAS